VVKIIDTYRILQKLFVGFLLARAMPPAGIGKGAMPLEMLQLQSAFCVTNR